MDSDSDAPRGEVGSEEEADARSTYSMRLVRLHREGDAAALDELLRRYEPRLRRIIRLKLDPRLQRRVDVDDVVQEVLLVAALKVRDIELRSDASILQWLSSIAANRIKKRLEHLAADKRDPGREVRLAVDSGSLPGVLPEARDPTPSENARGAELGEIFAACLAELDPPEYALVIRMRDEQGRDWEGIRDRLERPSVAAAQELYRRARSKLREKIRTRLGPD